MPMEGRISVHPVGPEEGGAFVEMMNRSYNRKKDLSF